MNAMAIAFSGSLIALGAWTLYARFRRPWASCVMLFGIVISLSASATGGLAKWPAGKAAQVPSSKFDVGTSIFAGEISKPADGSAKLEVPPVFVSSVSESGLYHHPGCRYEKRMEDKFRMTFDSPQAAEAAGYKPCEWCK